MLGENWKKRGVEPYREPWSLFLVGVRLIILLASVGRQSWMWWAHECKSLKHRGEKGDDETPHVLQEPEGLHGWEEPLLLQCSLTPTMACTVSYIFHLVGDLRSPSEEARVLRKAVVVWPYWSEWALKRHFVSLKAQGIKQGFFHIQQLI